ncbi:MAG TPA: isoprenylcysteine carboxylmethyltransferase family protein [Steroidobacteraceae bacterium]
MHVFRFLIPAMWLAWLVFWRISAADVKATQRFEPAWSRALHFVPLLLAAILLAIAPEPHGGWLFQHFLPRGAAKFWTGAGLTAAGIAFACWARVHLGRNWSGAVSVKQDHELIRSGPYALVRHPIYSGLLLGVLGTVIALGQWRGVLALVIVLLALWRKLRLEERWMSETFGEKYQRYREHTAALIPYLL